MKIKKKKNTLSRKKRWHEKHEAGTQTLERRKGTNKIMRDAPGCPVVRAAGGMGSIRGAGTKMLHDVMKKPKRR